MTKLEPREPSKIPGADAEARAKRMMKGALVFGVVAATIEMGLLLWFLYC